MSITWCLMMLSVLVYISHMPSFVMCVFPVISVGSLTKPVERRIHGLL